LKKFPIRPFNPERSARERHEDIGKVPISDLSRVMEVVASDKGYVNAEMNFSIEKGKIVIIALKIDAEIELTCQRTLNPFTYAINSQIELAVVESEKQMEYLSDHYEPVIIENGLLDPKEIIEEEILLAIPVISKSRLNDCDLSGNSAYFSASKIEEDEKICQKPNPFAILSTLKHKKN
jgi:uncharacterized protein